MKSMKKGLSILLCLCLVVTTVYGCFTFEALADGDNLWSYGTNENVPSGFTSGISGTVNSYGFFANTVSAGVVNVTVDSGGYNSANALHLVSTYVNNSVGRIIEIEQGKTYKISFKYKGDGKGYPFLRLNMDDRAKPAGTSPTAAIHGTPTKRPLPPRPVITWLFCGLLRSQRQALRPTFIWTISLYLK